jgi:multiple sugar transport system ATP-binding protein
MGRAIVRDPQVFLFDEPLSNLDAKLRVAMRAEIRELHQRLKATTVYVTHDQIEAMTMADKIVAMHDGIVEQVGTPIELFDRPRNVFVAAFIGSPSMNLVPVKVNGQGVVDNAGNHWNVPHVPATSGQALTLGVRPEHLRLDDAGVEARVLVVESTGSETHLVVDAGGIKLTCVLRERVSLRPGDHVRLGADNAHLHLFHGDSGERLEPVH